VPSGFFLQHCFLKWSQLALCNVLSGVSKTLCYIDKDYHNPKLSLYLTD
jgi:hypothetical protein